MVGMHCSCFVICYKAVSKHSYRHTQWVGALTGCNVGKASLLILCQIMATRYLSNENRFEVYRSLTRLETSVPYG